jgi:UDP-N-acetylmuramate--alanine ligase
MTHYHIVGIGGSGMSALAHLLLDRGHQVSGSDQQDSPALAGLRQRGAAVSIGHHADQVQGAEIVLTSAAIPADHVETAAARAAGIPLQTRADLWRAWSQERPIIAIAGTHGKTTTTAMTALALRAGGINCGWLVGADVPELGGAAAWGDAAAPLVVEADEYARAFLALTPETAIITGVEWDHPDQYPTAEAYRAVFAEFAGRVRDPRRLLLCADDAAELLWDLPEALTYGVDEVLSRDPQSCRTAPLDWAATDLEERDGQLHFQFWHYDQRRFARRLVGPAALSLSGIHNVRNALAALAAAELYGADRSAALSALAAFRGSARRFSIIGSMHDVLVIDDYAHHPTAVRLTIDAVRSRFAGRRVLAYLQPHTFSRTAALAEQWQSAGAGAALLLVGNIYAAREQGDNIGVARELAAQMAAAGTAAEWVGTPADAAERLAQLVQPGDVVLIMGAGDSTTVGPQLLQRLEARA